MDSISQIEKLNLITGEIMIVEHSAVGISYNSVTTESDFSNFQGQESPETECPNRCHQVRLFPSSSFRQLIDIRV